MSRLDWLCRAFGLPLGDDVVAVMDLARRLEPQDPAGAFYNVLGIQLCGPFDFMDADLPAGLPPAAVLLHGRFVGQPPEFHTVMTSEDGWLCGLWSDDGTTLSGQVAGYHAEQRRMEVAGANLMEALRLRLEMVQAHLDAGEPQPEHARALEQLRQQMGALQSRSQTGKAYVDAYAGAPPRENVLPTKDGMGVHGLPPPGAGLDLDAMERMNAPASALEAQYHALSKDPSAALVLGRNLLGDGEHPALATAVLEVGYAACNRPTLGALVRATLQNAGRSSVDIREAPTELNFAALEQPADPGALEAELATCVEDALEPVLQRERNMEVIRKLDAQRAARGNQKRMKEFGAELYERVKAFRRTPQGHKPRLGWTLQLSRVEVRQASSNLEISESGAVTWIIARDTPMEELLALPQLHGLALRPPESTTFVGRPATLHATFDDACVFTAYTLEAAGANWFIGFVAPRRPQGASVGALKALLSATPPGE